MDLIRFISGRRYIELRQQRIENPIGDLSRCVFSVKNNTLSFFAAPVCYFLSDIQKLREGFADVLGDFGKADITGVNVVSKRHVLYILENITA